MVTKRSNKVTLTTVVLLCISFSVVAQPETLEFRPVPKVEFQSITTNDKANPTFKIIKFNLNNLILCMDMPISEFEALLVANGFGLWTPNHDEYSNGNSTWGYQTITKEPGLLTIFFSDNWKVETKAIFNPVLDQLEKYYEDRDNDVVIYRFMKGTKTYMIKVIKENLLLRIYVK